MHVRIRGPAVCCEKSVVAGVVRLVSFTHLRLLSVSGSPLTPCKSENGPEELVPVRACGGGRQHGFQRQRRSWDGRCVGCMDRARPLRFSHGRIIHLSQKRPKLPWLPPAKSTTEQRVKFVPQPDPPRIRTFGTAVAKNSGF